MYIFFFKSAVLITLDLSLNFQFLWLPLHNLEISSFEFLLEFLILMVLMSSTIYILKFFDNISIFDYTWPFFEFPVSVTTSTKPGNIQLWISSWISYLEASIAGADLYVLKGGRHKVDKKNIFSNFFRVLEGGGTGQQTRCPPSSATVLLSGDCGTTQLHSTNILVGAN